MRFESHRASRLHRAIWATKPLEYTLFSQNEEFEQKEFLWLREKVAYFPQAIFFASKDVDPGAIFLVSQTIAATSPVLSLKMAYCGTKTGLGGGVSQKSLPLKPPAIGGVAGLDSSDWGALR